MSIPDVWVIPVNRNSALKINKQFGTPCAFHLFNSALDWAVFNKLELNPIRAKLTSVPWGKQSRVVWIICDCEGVFIKSPVVEQSPAPALYRTRADAELDCYMSDTCRKIYLTVGR